MKIPHLTFIVHSLFSNHLLWKKDFLLGVVNLEIDNLLKLLIFNIVICGDKVRYFYFLWAVVNNPLQTLIFCSKAHGKYEVNAVFWLVGKMGPSSPLGIACSDPLQKKKKKGHGGDLKVHNCQTVSNEVTKSGRRQSKQRKHEQGSWVYCATNTVVFLSWLSKSFKQVILDFYWSKIFLQ